MTEDDPDEPCTLFTYGLCRVTQVDKGIRLRKRIPNVLTKLSANFGLVSRNQPAGDIYVPLAPCGAARARDLLRKAAQAFGVRRECGHNEKLRTIDAPKGLSLFSAFQ